MIDRSSLPIPSFQLVLPSWSDPCIAELPYIAKLPYIAELPCMAEPPCIAELYELANSNRRAAYSQQFIQNRGYTLTTLATHIYYIFWHQPVCECVEVCKLLFFTGFKLCPQGCCKDRWRSLFTLFQVLPERIPFSLYITDIRVVCLSWNLRFSNRCNDLLKLRKL